MANEPPDLMKDWDEPKLRRFINTILSALQESMPEDVEGLILLMFMDDGITQYGSTLEREGAVKALREFLGRVETRDLYERSEFKGAPEDVKLFHDQTDGTAPRKYPDGRAGADDDGEFAVAVAADRQYGIIRVMFPRETKWFGLDPEGARAFIKSMQGKLAELKG